MKYDFSAKILNHLGEAIKAEENKELTLKDVIFALGGIQYQGQSPDEKAKIGSACWKAAAGEDLTSEEVSALKNAAKQVYNPIVFTAVTKAFEQEAAASK